MKKKISPGNVTQSVLRSMLAAGEDSVKWTKGNAAPWEAPEYLYGARVARDLFKNFRCQIYCEYNARDAVRDSVEQRFGRFPKVLRKGTRPDILLANSDGYWKMMIEIKRRVWDFSDIKKDIVKIGSVLSSSGDDLHTGTSAFILRWHENYESGQNPGRKDFKNAKSKLENRIKKELQLKAQKTLEDNFRVSSMLADKYLKYYYEDDDGNLCWSMWTVGALRISIR